jgi:hypothetical protein
MSHPKEDGYWIFRTRIRTRSGRIIYAHWYGLKAFRIWIKSRAA